MSNPLEPVWRAYCFTRDCMRAEPATAFKRLTDFFVEAGLISP